jgi:hypothetical protein
MEFRLDGSGGEGTLEVALGRRACRCFAEPRVPWKWTKIFLFEGNEGIPATTSQGFLVHLFSGVALKFSSAFRLNLFLPFQTASFPHPRPTLRARKPEHAEDSREFYDDTREDYTR